MKTKIILVRTLNFMTYLFVVYSPAWHFLAVQAVGFTTDESVHTWKFWGGTFIVPFLAGVATRYRNGW